MLIFVESCKNYDIVNVYINKMEAFVNCLLCRLETVKA